VLYVKRKIFFISCLNVLIEILQNQKKSGTPEHSTESPDNSSLGSYGDSTDGRKNGKSEDWSAASCVVLIGCACLQNQISYSVIEENLNFVFEWPEEILLEIVRENFGTPYLLSSDGIDRTTSVGDHPCLIAIWPKQIKVQLYPHNCNVNFINNTLPGNYFPF
jgi:hypothetical protein